MSPELLPALRVEGVDTPVGRGDVDDAVRHRRRRPDHAARRRLPGERELPDVAMAEDALVGVEAAVTARLLPRTSLRRLAPKVNATVRRPGGRGRRAGRAGRA